MGRWKGTRDNTWMRRWLASMSVGGRARLADGRCVRSSRRTAAGFCSLRRMLNVPWTWLNVVRESVPPRCLTIPVFVVYSDEEREIAVQRQFRPDPRMQLAFQQASPGGFRLHLDN